MKTPWRLNEEETAITDCNGKMLIFLEDLPETNRQLIVQKIIDGVNINANKTNVDLNIGDLSFNILMDLDDTEILEEEGHLIRDEIFNSWSLEVS